MSIVTITLTKEQAERFSHAVSDVTCWSSGFAAGLATADFQAVDGPLSVNVLRELNVAIKDAQDKAENGTEGAFVRVFDNGGIGGVRPGRSSFDHALNSGTRDPSRHLICRLVPVVGNVKLLDMLKEQQK